MRLLQAAAGLFASRSFETVSTRAIAKEAGVDAALIHHYFGSKEGGGVKWWKQRVVSGKLLVG